MYTLYIYIYVYTYIHTYTHTYTYMNLDDVLPAADEDVVGLQVLILSSGDSRFRDGDSHVVLYSVCLRKT